MQTPGRRQAQPTATQGGVRYPLVPPYLPGEIWNEAARWTLVSTMLPIVLGVVMCFLVAQVWRLLVY